VTVLRGAALLALAVALLAAAPASAARPADLALRLADLGAGYVIPAGTCVPTRLRGDGESRVVDQIAAMRHRGCEIEFSRVWVAPGAPAGPDLVSSRTFLFDDVAGPRLALTRPRALISATYVPARKDLEMIAPAPEIGDQAVLLREEDGLGRYIGWRSFVLWRSGNVLAVVQASSEQSPDASVQAALRLAGAQQVRIAAPTPLGPADNDDADVGLSTPGFDLPIYWLGHDLAARGRLPSLTLNVSAPLPTRGGPSMTLLYGDDATVAVDLWRPRTMRRSFFRSAMTMIAHDPCTHRKRIRLAQGRATIWSFGGRRCDTRLEARLAVMRLPGAVVMLSVDTRRRPTRYATRAGMLRLLRALQPYAPEAPAPAP
jgi:hypothetical protein